MSILTKSLGMYLIILGILGGIGFTIPVLHMLMIAVGCLAVGLNSEGDITTMIYFDTEGDDTEGTIDIEIDDE